jgi:hypothetical protein
MLPGQFIHRKFEFFPAWKVFLAGGLGYELGGSKLILCRQLKPARYQAGGAITRPLYHRGVDRPQVRRDYQAKPKQRQTNYGANQRGDPTAHLENLFGLTAAITILSQPHLKSNAWVLDGGHYTIVQRRRE